MENNLENKAKFFSQYMGVEVDISETEYYKEQQQYKHITECKLIGLRVEPKDNFLIMMQTNLRSQNNGYLQDNGLLYFTPGICTLKLRPLSSITDEEAIEVAKIEFAVFQCIGFEFKVSRNTKEPIKVWVFRGNEVVKIIEITTGYLHLEATDYLRSKGFALPYHDLTVEQLIEYGWIKFTTNES